MTRERGRNVRRIVSLIATGLSVGWITGLSASPVAHAVLATVLGLANAVLLTIPSDDTTDSTGAQKFPRLHMARGARDENLLLIGIFSLFVAVGAAAGVYTRANEFLGLSPSRVALKWKATGLSDDAIARRLFDEAFPAALPSRSNKDDRTAEVTGNPHQGALYNSAGDKECDEYNSVEDFDLRRLMLASANHAAKALAEVSADPKVLRVAVKELICAR
jgi:hypothetical protein